MIVAQDLATAAGATLNGAYFARYGLSPGQGRARRLGAFALVLVSAGALLESAASQALLWARAAELSTEAWALVRLPALVATLVISLIVLRRIFSK
jgi:hypothetical protein